MTVSHKPMSGAIRALSMDAVEKAKSGHPGMPMGMSDVAAVLSTQFLKFDASNPLCRSASAHPTNSTSISVS
jgi:transketolase